ncbi:unnamed protein product [Moneuplotes crassus]|uniref:Uncharacterized protein n=1 Tax=Euplotes crassus TaxID=5936 RepID=A0AAD1XJP6_EUPCR|nr:unnamed protein product [Moneuplotes crassus]
MAHCDSCKYHIYSLQPRVNETVKLVELVGTSLHTSSCNPDCWLIFNLSFAP